MKGLSEIVVSGVVACSSLLAFAEYRKFRSDRASGDLNPDPVTLTGESEDPNLNLKWGLEAIHLRSARTRDHQEAVVVAVIDTGCDVHHPDLAAGVWRNPGESGIDENGSPRGSNGIDDDDNGFVDDIHGWNFASNTSDLEDHHGHGTHIAGLIGARSGEPDGLRGVAPNARLMILKYFDSERSGKENLDHTISAIRYAVRMGADIINYSGGGLLKSPEEAEVLRWASAQGVLVVAAAGNEGLNSDFYPFYPADYELPNILSVGAVDIAGELLNLSNFGVHTVHLVAPGKNIYSTLPEGRYGFMTGTSQATAFVSGVAALLIAQDARFREPPVLIDHLMLHSSRRPNLRGKTRSGAMLDARMALDTGDMEIGQFRRVRAPSEATN